jgi:hypothetical protein
MSVGGKSIFRVMGISTSYFDPTGLAAARMDVRAFRVVMIPALAMETVCCSCEDDRIRMMDWGRVGEEEVYHHFVQDTTRRV